MYETALTAFLLINGPFVIVTYVPVYAGITLNKGDTILVMFKNFLLFQILLCYSPMETVPMALLNGNMSVGFTVCGFKEFIILLGLL